jgi:predicted metal-dependent phosphoesterase TrpH
MTTDIRGETLLIVSAEQAAASAERSVAAHQRSGKADLQVHSSAGDGLDGIETILESVEESAELDIIALTDHDDVRPSHALRDLAARRGARVQVVPGVEVTTRHGHLLALFVEDEVPMLRPLVETVRFVHERGGICIVPHPLSYLTFSIGEGVLRKLIAAGERVDGFETVNPSIAGRVRAARALALNREFLNAAETGSSDAHQAALVGTAWTEFPGRSIEDLRRAIGERRTRAAGRRWSVREHLDGAARQQWRSLIVHPAAKVRRRLTR